MKLTNNNNLINNNFLHRKHQSKINYVLNVSIIIWVIKGEKLKDFIKKLNINRGG